MRLSMNWRSIDERLVLSSRRYRLMLFRCARRRANFSSVIVVIPSTLPLSPRSIDCQVLTLSELQLWAEAVTLYQAGIPWWLTKKETQIDAYDNRLEVTDEVRNRGGFDGVYQVPHGHDS